jgi:NADPH-dependent curcumin reductase CurA
MINRQLVLVSRPHDRVSASNFELRHEETPELQEGEALVRVELLGIDPTQRTWLNADATYTSPARIGAVMPGSGVGQVVASRNVNLSVGDWVAGATGWQDYVVARDGGLFGLNPVPEGVDPKDMLNLLGASGLTAYFGMLEVGQVKAGETVFVSAAAGSVGSIAGQIARLKGCRVIGSAGGDRKRRWVTEVARLDACIDYKAGSLSEQLSALAPDGVDVVFDNVGGAVLEAALDHLALHARVVLSGSVSSGYRNNDYGQAPRNYMQLAFRRSRMEGFIFLDHLARFPQAFADLTHWRRIGDIVTAETVTDGLENAPEALAGLFEGKNLGKQLVRLSGDRL